MCKIAELQILFAINLWPILAQRAEYPIRVPPCTYVPWPGWPIPQPAHCWKCYAVNNGCNDVHCSKVKTSDTYTNHTKISDDVRTCCNNESSSIRLQSTHSAQSCIYKCSWIRVDNFQSHFVSMTANSRKRIYSTWKKPRDSLNRLNVLNWVKSIRFGTRLHHELPLCDAINLWCIRCAETFRINLEWKTNLKCRGKVNRTKTIIFISAFQIKHDVQHTAGEKRITSAFKRMFN